MSFQIVYIDDEPDICEIFSDLFQSSTLDVHVFTDPELAIERLKSHSADIVFIDYRLPQTTGDQVARRISKDIPKALITGELSVQPDYEFDRIFSKPLDVDEIEKFISKHTVK